METNVGEATGCYKIKIVYLKTSFMKQVILVKKLVGLLPPRTRITWAYFLGLEDPLLKLLRSAKV